MFLALFAVLLDKIVKRTDLWILFLSAIQIGRSNLNFYDAEHAKRHADGGMPALLNVLYLFADLFDEHLKFNCRSGDFCVDGF